MLTAEQCQSLIETIRDSLKWDLINEAQKLTDKPEEFEKFFRKYNSGIICDIVFDKADPTLIGIEDSWIKVLTEWSFKTK